MDEGNKSRTNKREKRREALLKGGKLTDKEQIHILNGEIQALKGRLRDANADNFDSADIKRKVFRIAEGEIEPPKWLIKATSQGSKTTGIPTIFASDWHYGEKVFESQIGYVNSFDLKIADQRIQALVNNSLEILFHHMAKPKYDGLVFPLGGDMFSGNIHEELTNTNEEEMFQLLLRLTSRIAWAIKIFADRFGRVHIPVVTGNHGRTSRKPIHKNRAFNNFDWLLGCMLEREFKHDKRITFQISDGTDAHYDIYGHRYNLTHGDQFSGGDSIVGAIGAVSRGDSKKRSRDGQVGQPYDTLICGHFHQLTIMKKIIINGSLKGYDEYAHAHNFGFEPAQQAMWLTHPDHGITFNMPVFLTEPTKGNKSKPISFDPI